MGADEAFPRVIPPVPPARDPEHDSLFLRFEQLDSLLDTALHSPYAEEAESAAYEARKLVRLIRAQVLK